MECEKIKSVQKLARKEEEKPPPKTAGLGERGEGVNLLYPMSSTLPTFHAERSLLNLLAPSSTAPQVHKEVQ